jgi:hypothetical protein
MGGMDDRLLYTVTRLAMARGEVELAAILLECECYVSQWDEWTDEVTLCTPPESFETLRNGWGVGSEPLVHDSYLDFLFERAKDGRDVHRLVLKPSAFEMEENWRAQLRSQIEGEASNQGRPFGDSRIVVHNGLNYRSQSEVAVAKQLERTDEILFFPNAGAVAGKVPKEPDFLVFFRNKVGVLEVDGPTHAGRAADDSIRDSYFQRHGLFVKHYPSEKCLNDAEWVVKDFLRLLLKS